MNAKEKEALRREVLEALEQRPRARRDILVIDDDPDVCEALRMLLEKAYAVVALSRGDKLLEMLDSYEPVLLILDVNLPGKNGFELCRQVRSSPRHRHLPVLFLTVRRDDESFANSLQANADAFLNKPFGKKELRDTIHRLVGARQQP
ncbi:MAG: response regulator [Elusimicrobia bacterium]|nr:response regulator [Elusimicrobiota bacterium]